MFKSLKNNFLLWLMSGKLYKHCLMKVIPYIRFTTYYCSLRGDKYHEGYAALKPGHVILGADHKKLTSLLIPGVMSHAAFCLGTRREDPTRDFEICEMTHTNWTRSDFFDICKEADRVVLMRCVDFTEKHIGKMKQAAITLQHSTYDIHFTLGIETLYCSELVYQADRLADFWLNPEKKGAKGLLQISLDDLAGLGRPYVSPDGLLYGLNMVCDWDSDGIFTGKTGTQIREIVRAQHNRRRFTK